METLKTDGSILVRALVNLTVECFGEPTKAGGCMSYTKNIFYYELWYDNCKFAFGRIKHTDRYEVLVKWGNHEYYLQLLEFVEFTKAYKRG